MPKQKSPDKILLAILLTIITFGLVMIASAGIAYSRTRFGDSYFFFKHQLFYGVVPGLIFLFMFFVPGLGSRIYGASRWLQLGSFSFQPSEMLKLSIILYLAAWLENRLERVKDFYEGLVPFLAIIGFVSFLLIKQPDMGTLGVIILISMSIFFVSGAKISHIAMMALGGFLSLVMLIKFESYRMDRLMVYLHPEIDPRGIGYQINQALLAIGSGGVLGLGLGNSLQKFNYLPEPVGDSIFAIIGEELGMVGAVFVVALFILLAARGLKIAKNAPDRFAKLAAIGISSWIFFQSFINISAICGIIPLTGIPLPFISYGGTSIIFLMIGVGILLNISKYSEIN